MGSNWNGCWVPFQPTMGRHALQQLVGDHKQGDAAVRGQPLVPAAHERVSRPRAQAHRHRSRHLGDVDDDTRPDRVSTPNDLADVDQRPGRELDRTETHRGGAALNAVDKRRREILSWIVLDPLDHRAEPLARTKPRIGDAGEIRRHQNHLAAGLRRQDRELTERLTRSSHHRYRPQRRVKQPGRSLAEVIQNPLLGGVREPHVAVLRHIDEEVDHRFRRTARNQAKRRLIQIHAPLQRGVLLTRDHGRGQTNARTLLSDSRRSPSRRRPASRPLSGTASCRSPGAGSARAHRTTCPGRSRRWAAASRANPGWRCCGRRCRR